MKDKILECWLHSCLYRRERQVQPHQEFITLTEEILCQDHHAFQSWRKLAAMYSQKKKSSRDRDYPQLQADKAAEGEEPALSNLSDAGYHARLLLEKQRNQVVSEARSEMNLHELRVERGDMALREENLQILSRRMELHRANQSHEHSRRDRVWHRTELEERERALQETRMRTVQEIEEFQKYLLY